MTVRGRPTFAPTRTQQRKVSVAAGAGMAHEEIARAIGISRTTLLKHFNEELTVGASKCRMEILEAVYRAAKKGKVAAARAYSQIAAAKPASGEAAPDMGEGKKERAQRDAEVAQHGTAWDSALTPPTNLQ